MANKEYSVLNGIIKRLADIGSGHHAEVIAVVNPDGSPISAGGGGGGGSGTSDTTEATQLLVKAAVQSIDTDVGALADAAAEADGTGNYSIISALKRGLLNWAALLGRIPALVGGRLPVDGSGVTQPVSATSLPLPTGAATSAAQTTGNNSLASIDGKVPTGLSTTLINGKNRLDVTLGSGGAIGAAAPAFSDLVAGVDGSGNLRGLATDANGRIQTDVRAAGSAAAITIGTAFAVCRGIYVGSGGTIVATINAANITFVGVAPGSILPVAATNIVSAGTTASNLVALY